MWVVGLPSLALALEQWVGLLKTGTKNGSKFSGAQSNIRGKITGMRWSTTPHTQTHYLEIWKGHFAGRWSGDIIYLFSRRLYDRL